GEEQGPGQERGRGSRRSSGLREGPEATGRAAETAGPSAAAQWGARDMDECRAWHTEDRLLVRPQPRLVFSGSGRGGLARGLQGVPAEGLGLPPQVGGSSRSREDSPAAQNQRGELGDRGSAGITSAVVGAGAGAGPGSVAVANKARAGAGAGAGLTVHPFAGLRPRLRLEQGQGAEARAARSRGLGGSWPRTIPDLDGEAVADPELERQHNPLLLQGSLARCSPLADG
ncbi:unnamed protein product, partial [Discosporangium mesarthrocarpum]